MKFIAEIGLNHNGNIDLIHELIRQSSICGANFAKFQLGWKGKPGELNYIDKTSFESILKSCEFNDIEFLSSIFYRENFEFIKKYKSIKKFKIASRTIVDDIELVKDILDYSDHLFISLGMWKKKDLPFKPNPKITYFWCKSLYPTLPSDLLDFPKTFVNSDVTGYSDHSIGIDVPILAASRGANFIEKHFTLDKSDNTIRDHALSATPAEFQEMVIRCKYIKKYVDLGI